MDFRGTKLIDYVSATENLAENARKTKNLQIKWLRNYQWLCDKYRQLEKDQDHLCAIKLARQRDKSNESRDKRTILPFPTTSNQFYGWLAGKPDFQLEVYGSPLIRYPDPMDEVVLLTGNVPRLAGGRGFY